ncbi:MAG: 23S rRNA (uracil(1939)-C(5))-methyltransferase RlmD [Candidatus Diapherotrites archaeon]|nr:23S rRNA (uracil(1939)-C(5))-methyltransferase RlmD [Candidatus Diapherotrites archaeon]
MKCKHLSECRGCPLAEYSYKKQLEIKEKKLEELFNGRVTVTPSPLKFRYRSKAELSVEGNIIGFRKNSREVFELEECLLLSRRANKLIDAAQRIVSKLKSKNLRYFSLRDCLNSKQLQCWFSFWPKIDINKKEIEFIADSLANYCQSLHFVQSYSYASALGKSELIFGKPHVYELLLDKKFYLSPQSFFQSNVKAFELALQEIRKKAYGKVLDVYCGVGTIGLSIADSKHIANVVGIEIMQEQIELANINAKANRIHNVEFFTGKARVVLKKFIQQHRRFDTVIVDPPRAGLDKKTLLRIALLKPSQIIYMACNPESLARDIEEFRRFDFELQSIKGFDFFPQTSHVECLAVLS